MLKLIDTHAHMYLPEFDQDIDKVIHESIEVGVEKIFMPNIDNNTIEGMLLLEKRHKNHCFPMMGLHPCYVKENYTEELSLISKWFERRKFCAVGEIGIDLYWDKTFVKEQIKAFETQIRWAKEHDIPIIIHCRESLDMSIEIVATHQDGSLRGIFHCFSGNADQANKIIDLDFLLGIGGVVTFKNGGLDKVIPDIDLSRMVLETDSPYLAPTPYRGKRNSPIYLGHIAQRIADLKECSIEEVAKITTKTANNIFGHG